MGKTNLQHLDYIRAFRKCITAHSQNSKHKLDLYHLCQLFAEKNGLSLYHIRSTVCSYFTEIKSVSSADTIV